MRFKKYLMETSSNDISYMPYNYSAENAVEHEDYSEFPNFCHPDWWNWDKKDIVGNKEKKKNAKTTSK